MKSNLLSIIFLILAFAANAQQNELTWFDNLEEATTYATTNQTNILMVFAGSDWCKPCIKFKKDILESTEFQSWAKTNLVVLYLDFPARKKNKLSASKTAHNEALAEQYNKSGAFPNIFLLDANQKVLANPEFKGQDATDYITALKTAYATK